MPFNGDRYTRHTSKAILLTALSYALAAFAMAVLIAVLWVAAAEAHSWYDKECCSGKDCAEVVAMNTGPNGRAQFTNAHGLVAEFNSDTRVKRSKDSQYHACIVGVKLRCLYTPWVGGEPWPNYHANRSASAQPALTGLPMTSPLMAAE